MCKLIKLCLVLASVFTLSSCGRQQYIALFQQKNAAESVIYNDTVGDYHIRPHDLLLIKNLQDISYIVSQPADRGSSGGSSGQGQTFEVNDEGKVTLPIVGAVTVGGRTRVEAKNMIEVLYRKNLLKDPIIDLKITNLKVTVFGEVKGQGNFPLVKDRTTLVELLGEAGGITESADETNVQIIRGTEKNPKVTRIDLSAISAINDPRAILQNGDIIYISKNRRAIRNDKIQNFSSVYQPAVLLLNTLLLIFTFSRIK
ncbi:polysaccharide biosynthesis/export family protein [Mucilaginibacter flavus]|uniref:polysaccharide biosynthesis/export family protein n=1 Tax=Mucilaginibacter flavus TaxID=931504 RepID=UPI0025B35F20|nr:polysaccharide biosynthesis/export family protein [Mucilaginibacter flavus]MDN3584395.1 polysaccharide biosynthesis/export family protein [Mucilaginibacter flavus]